MSELQRVNIRLLMPYEVVRIRRGLKLNYILLYKLLFPHGVIFCFRRNHWLFHVLWHCATLDNWKSHCCAIESKHGKQSLYATIKRMQKCYDVLHTWTPVSPSSGVNASPEVQQDLLHAKIIVEEKSSTFIQARIKSNDVPFNHPIKKNNLKTFSSTKFKKSTKVRDKNVLIKADRDFFGRMLILQEKDVTLFSYYFM